MTFGLIYELAGSPQIFFYLRAYLEKALFKGQSFKSFTWSEDWQERDLITSPNHQITMIDPSETPCYIAYGLICFFLVVAYIRIKSDEGTVITTKEFQNFQTGFVTGYAAIILCELIAAASFYHTFVSLHLSLEQITKLYITTVVSSTVTHLVTEVVDLGAKRDKCVLSALLYSVSMFSIFFGGHYEMLLMGRIVYGAASALQHSAFEAYAVHEHSSRGFPEDWLSHTFSFLSHTMALVAALSGVVGQVSANLGKFGCVTACCVLFASTALYLLVVWEKDVNIPRYMMTGFIYNFNQVLGTVRTNRPMLYLMLISSLCESSIIIFTFYWAPWLTDLFKEEDQHIPYEIIFSCFVACSMFGNYLFQILVGRQQNSLSFGIDQLFQIVLIASSTSYFLGAIVDTPLLAFGMALVIQCSVGMYWPCIGYFRGRIIVPELRNTTLTLSK